MERLIADRVYVFPRPQIRTGQIDIKNGTIRIRFVNIDAFMDEI